MIPAIEKPKNLYCWIQVIKAFFRNAFIDKHMDYVTIIYFLQQKKE